MLEPQLFALVDAEDERGVYAYGIDTGEEACTFRRDPITRKTQFSVCQDADAAFELAARLLRSEVTLKLIRYDVGDRLDDDEFEDDDFNPFDDEPSHVSANGAAEDDGDAPA